METKVQYYFQKGSPIITILSQINPIPRTYFFKIISNIILLFLMIIY